MSQTSKPPPIVHNACIFRHQNAAVGMFVRIITMTARWFSCLIYTVTCSKNSKCQFNLLMDIVCMTFYYLCFILFSRLLFIIQRRTDLSCQFRAEFQFTALFDAVLMACLRPGWQWFCLWMQLLQAQTFFVFHLFCLITLAKTSPDLFLRGFLSVYVLQNQEKQQRQQNLIMS